MLHLGDRKLNAAQNVQTVLKVQLTFAVSIVVKIKPIHTASACEGIWLIFVNEYAGFTVCNIISTCWNISIKRKLKLGTLK